MNPTPEQPQCPVRDSTDRMMVAFNDAMKWGNVGEVRRLLSNGFDPNTFERHEDIEPAHILLSAIKLEATGATFAKVLLDAGANPRLAKPAYGDRTLLVSAIYLDDLDLAQSLIESGADVNEASPEGWTAAHVAAREYSTACFLELLDRHGGNFDVTTKGGLTPLMLGAASPETARFLLSKLSHRINARDSDGMTALLYAIEGDNLESVNLMLGADADPSVGIGIYKNAEEFARDRSREVIANQVAMVRAARDAKTLIESLRTSIGARPAA